MSISTVWAGLLATQFDTLEEVTDTYLAWSQSLGPKWSGLAWFTPTFNKTLGAATWEVMLQYVYLGGEADPEYQATWVPFAAKFSAFNYLQSARNYTKWWDYVNMAPLEPIYPVDGMQPSATSVGGVPSVLVQRDIVNTTYKAQLLASMKECVTASSVCTQNQIYQDITGNVGATQAAGTAISDNFRTALYHVVFTPAPPSVADAYYQLGSNSYFSESAYEMSGWQDRYWGDHADTLLSIKQRWDPSGVFGCRHCVGDTSS